MGTEKTSLGASRNNTIILGSGLSGMVAAYISAKAREDNAAMNEDWHAQQAFRPRLPRRRNRTSRPGGTGATLAS